MTEEQIKAAIERGPHLSAMKPAAMRAFREEFAKKVGKNQVRILSLGMMLNLTLQSRVESVTDGTNSSQEQSLQNPARFVTRVEEGQGNPRAVG